MPPSRVRRHRGRGRTVGASHEPSLVSLRNHLAYAKRSRRALKATLQALQQSKQREHSNRTTAAFAAKIALASPSASGRSFADAGSDLIGTEASGCSRRTIARVRDAFCCVCKDLYCSNIEERVASASPAASALDSRPRPPASAQWFCANTTKPRCACVQLMMSAARLHAAGSARSCSTLSASPSQHESSFSPSRQSWWPLRTSQQLSPPERCLRFCKQPQLESSWAPLSALTRQRFGSRMCWWVMAFPQRSRSSGSPRLGKA